MIESLITSKTRIKILLKFFLNCKIKSHLRGLETEFEESSNSIRVELNKLENAGLLNSIIDGNKKLFFANTTHPLFNDIQNIMKKFVGIDQIIEIVISHTLNLNSAYLAGDFATGKNSQIIDLIMVGDNLNRITIDNLILKAEDILNRRIKYIILNKEEMFQIYNNKSVLLIWSLNPY